MECKILFCLLLWSAAILAAADKGPSYRQRSAARQHYSTVPKYRFDYGVRDRFSGNNFGAKENRNGDHTRGSYYVDLPDGRRQKVTYYVTKDSGFMAEVTYEAKAKYPKMSRRSKTYG